MKRTVMAAMVLSLATGSVALADPPQDYHHDRDQRQEQRHDAHQDRDQRHDEHHDRREDRGHQMRGREHFDSGRYLRPRGYYTHHWRHGDRLPPAWRGPAYVIPDWGYYRLQPPPPGYYWVRVNDSAVLAAIATGIVVDVAVNVFH
jgi:Ni/Co efflux regulator RcnB